MKDCRHSTPTLGALTVLVTLLVAAGCATPDPPPMEMAYDFDESPQATDRFEGWLADDSPAIDEPTDAEDYFLAGELAYWAGDFEGAYGWYVAMLHRHPGHGLNRYAADRIFRLRYDVTDYANRIYGDLDGIRFDNEAALTRVELARIARHAQRDRWERSETDEPFSFAHGGEIATWRATPMLSPWRLLDFDTPMPPEETDRLSTQYRSPLIADADPANWELTRVVSVDGPRQSLRLGPSGIYYLEGQLTVDEAKTVTLSGRFPGAARVWIGDQEVFDRPEHDYEPGRMLRRIALDPGDHRVLVKLGYEPGHRDRFELTWIPDEGEVLADAGFRATPDVEGADAGLDILSETYRAGELEPVALGDVDDASGPALYLAATSAYISGETEAFADAWEELMERYPAFVPGHILGSYQVRTRADLPSDLRESKTITRLRTAQEQAPDNLHMLVQLERRLRDSGTDAEHLEVLERARDLAVGDESMAGEGTSQMPSTEAPEVYGARADTAISGGDVRQVRPLIAWARYLEDRGWSREAEEAWQRVVDVDPANCQAIRRLQRLYRTRNHMPTPEALADDADACFHVVDRWLADQPERIEERLEHTKRRALRHPWDASRQRQWADQLRSLDRRDEAVQVLDESIERMPWERSLWNARIDLATGDGDEETVRRLIDDVGQRIGRTSGLEMQRARLDDELPLEHLLRDGRQLAAEEIERTGVGDDVDEGEEGDRAMVVDDAYFVYDFAGRHYLDDGSSWTLTHQVKRLMTRGAINDHAEISVPGGAELLVARTIKEDGEVRVPDGVTGDSTLSMPGLAEGDMVELAYLEFRPASRLASRIDGSPFFFQMAHTSSRHSEYVVLSDGDINFESANGAPDAASLEVDGVEGVRFVARDSRRPRSESRRVGSLEYLPWVREYRRGVDAPSRDVERRYMQNAVAASAKWAPAVTERLESWIGGPVEDVETDDETIRDLFYAVSDWFRDPSPGSFATDAAHALERRRGSPLVVLHMALEKMGVDHDIYVARTDEQPPEPQAVGEINRYTRALMRIEMPESGDVVWIRPDRRDAMFGALEPEIDGQNAICITCEEFEESTVVLDDDRRPRRHIDLEAQLDDQGTLTGRITFEFSGARAARVRSALRNRTDEDDRRDYFERVLTDQISGADLIDYDVVDEDRPDRPLTFGVDFERTGFARVGDGRLVVDRPLFRESMQNIYARESTRRTPMFVGYEREQSYDVAIELPDDFDADLRADDVDETDNPFGTFERRSFVDDNTVHLESSIRLPRQRVYAADYDEFRRWARVVEESGRIWLQLE